MHLSPPMLWLPFVPIFLVAIGFILLALILFLRATAMNTAKGVVGDDDEEGEESSEDCFNTIIIPEHVNDCKDPPPPDIIELDVRKLETNINSLYD